MDERLSLLKKLCGAFGPTGCDGNIADIVRAELDGLCDEVVSCRDGSVIALRKGDGSSGKRFMLNGHMDEVGFMVTHIDDEGYIHVCCLGGIDPRVVCGRKVTIGDETRKITGIVSSKAIHQQSASERSEAVPVDKMYIDIGAENKEEAEKYVEVGDFAVYEGDFVEFGNGKIRSKAIDDRLGCALMILVLRSLKAENVVLPFDLYCAFSTLEEIGGMGAQTSVYRIAPDAGIVFEATAVSDVAGTPDECRVAVQGEGGCISMLDRTTVYNMRFAEFAIKTGEKHNIKCQYKRYVSGGNDARHVQRVRAGALALTMSAPARYIHTPSNVIAASDYYAMCDLTCAILKDFDLSMLDWQ